MKPRHRRELARWLVALAGAGVLGVALLVVLAYWAVVRELPGESGGAHPPWYTDPADTSWQIPLGVADDAGLGRSAGRPIRVCGVTGQQAYLASLLCEGQPASPPFFDPFAVADAPREAVYPALRSRAVDRYEATCDGATVALFLSPYTCNSEVTDVAAGGFAPRFPLKN